MEANTEKIIIEKYLCALAELFECYIGSTPVLENAGDQRSDSEMTGVVSLFDELIFGSVTLSTRPKTAGRLAETSPLASADWLGEMCNQLAGRMKNKLLAYNLSPTLSTPAVICGKHLRINSIAKNNYIFRVESVLGVIESQLLPDTYSGGKIGLSVQMLGVIESQLFLDTPEDFKLTLNPFTETAVEGSLEMF